MNFSELFKQTNQLSRFSPNGKYLVSSRERTSFDLVHAVLTNFFFVNRVVVSSIDCLSEMSKPSRFSNSTLV